MVNREAFEAGDEIIEVERRPRSGVVVSVRLSPGEADRLEEIAQRRNLTMSQVVREAVSDYLGSGLRGPAAVVPLTGAALNYGSLNVIAYTSYGPGMHTSGLKMEAAEDVSS